MACKSRVIETVGGGPGHSSPGPGQPPSHESESARHSPGARLVPWPAAGLSQGRWQPKTEPVPRPRPAAGAPVTVTVVLAAACSGGPA